MTAGGRRTAGFLPLDEYAALSDGRSVALVGADGSIDWWCIPNMDSLPLFDRLLDPADGGRFSITPADEFTVERCYRADSNVLEQTFRTATGSARITDSLNSGSAGRLPWSELARRVEGLTGSVKFQVAALAGRRLAQATPWRESSPHGDVLHLDGIVAAIRGDARLVRQGETDRGVVGQLVTEAGSKDLIAMLASADEPLILPSLAAIDARIDRTDRAWREWTANLTYAGAFAGQVRRSALALKLLVFAPSGAIAAAATMGLPERIGGDKNYDCRYAWLRDVAYTTKAFLRVGATEEAKAAFSWMMATIKAHGRRLCALYRLDGSMSPEQRLLELPGYADSRPVRLGNDARDQLQLSIFGDVLETAALFVEQGHLLDLSTRALLADLANQCADTWRERDAGIWELKQLEHYTFSKMGCWTALDRAVALADLGQIDGSRVMRWRHERDHIREWIDNHCWSPAKQAYAMHAGSDRLDASLLLASRFGFDRPARLALTRDAIRKELAHGSLVYRYSGMEAEEGSFTACGFWMVEAYALLGDEASAMQQMQGMLSACERNLGLLGEQIDVSTGATLGNLPQALSHLALIHAASAISHPR